MNGIVNDKNVIHTYNKGDSNRYGFTYEISSMMMIVMSLLIILVMKMYHNNLTEIFYHHNYHHHHLYRQRNKIDTLTAQ